MTTTVSQEAREAEVTQADREAAADLYLALDGGSVDPSDIAYADAVRQGRCDDCAAVQAFARHRIEAARPVSGEPVAWQRRLTWPLVSAPPGSIPQWGACPAKEATDRFEATPGYEYRPLYAAPPVQSELVEALEDARRIIADIDDYMKRPGRGDWGEECACCMGELLDDDREAIARIDTTLAALKETDNG